VAKSSPRNLIEILRKQSAASGTVTAAPVTLNHGMPPRGPPQWWPLLFRESGGEMRVQGGRWLDHDSIALAVLVIGIGVVMLFALSI
jgi:hypothetical protein